VCGENSDGLGNSEFRGTCHAFVDAGLAVWIDFLCRRTAGDLAAARPLVHPGRLRLTEDASTAGASPRSTFLTICPAGIGI